MVREFSIGGVTVLNNVILAPMAGVTDKVFRGICAKMGCGLTYSEMVSAKALEYNNKNSLELLEIDKEEKLTAIQLFGSEPDTLASIAASLNYCPAAIIDINMGCPVNKIVKNKEGSALMKDPLKIGRIIEKTVKATNKPVTIKIRKGFDRNSVNACQVAKIAEESGASAIAVHGRTREEFYSGTADWDIIRQVKEAVKIPVIGNGDVKDGPSALAILKQTGCDAIMIGRAAQGNPWIFREIIHYLKTGELLERPSPIERIEMALYHTRRIIEYRGEIHGVIQMRKNICDYIKGLEGAKEARDMVNQIKYYSHLEEYLLNFGNSFV